MEYQLNLYSDGGAFVEDEEDLDNPANILDLVAADEEQALTAAKQEMSKHAIYTMARVVCWDDDSNQTDVFEVWRQGNSILSKPLQRGR